MFGGVWALIVRHWSSIGSGPDDSGKATGEPTHTNKKFYICQFTSPFITLCYIPAIRPWIVNCLMRGQATSESSWIDRSEELIHLTFGVVCVVWVLCNAVRCSQNSYLEERVYLAVLKSQCAKHSSLCFCFLFAFIFVLCFAFRSMISYLEERVYLAALESHCAQHWSSIG